MPQVSAPHSELLDALTAAQREAVTHPEGPLLIIAGAGTGKTTVITRRIAWLLATQRATPESLLALTFTEKAAAEMEERVDLLIPYGYSRLSISTFHAFGDQLLRQYALKMGFSSQFKVLSQAEQVVFLRQHLFELPLKTLRPLNDPTRFLEALLGVFSRAKDEAVTTEEFLACTDRLQQAAGGNEPALEALIQRTSEIALCYAAYQKLMRDADAIDFGDQVLLAIQLLEKHPDVLQAVRQRYAFLLVDEFQDTNFAQYRLLQLLAKPEGNITVVADDDQSIYKWRGAAISNVLKFLDHYPSRHTVVLTENFRSNQHILDAAYRLIRFNDPDRLEAQQGIDKRLISKAQQPLEMPHFSVFDDASAEADWVARTIRNAIEEQKRHPGDFAILVRSNREADLFLRAFNVAGIPWQFSGSSGLFARPESKMLLSCLKALADPHDSLSWYHIASSALYRCPMKDLAKILALAKRSHQSFQNILSTTSPELSEEGQRILGELKQDIEELLEFSRTQSSGQLLYHWLSKRGFLAHLARVEDLETSLQLQTVARFFAQLRRIEDLAGSSLPEVIQQLDLFQAIGNEPLENDDPLADRVNVLTLHKAKGLEFPVVFLVGLVQGRFPTPRRTETLELPNELIKDILPSGDYHLQEERRLFYVGMTRAKESLYLSCAYNYGGKSIRKISQFVVEALDLATPSPPAKRSSAKELIDRSRLQSPLPLKRSSIASKPQRLDPHGIDDYLTCPLKYRYSHVLRIPVMRHHLVVYGSALHKAVEEYFKSLLQGRTMSEMELLQIFERCWHSEGFLSREHEALRLEQGRKTLRRFFTQQQTAKEMPTFIEEKFSVPIGEITLAGRWDRVDKIADHAVIIDYKSSEVGEQAAADKRTRESLQLLFYALAWQKLHGQLPLRVELRFLETQLTGTAVFTQEDLERATALLQQAAEGIKNQEFSPTPQEFACRWCAFQAICPVAFQTR